MRVVPRPSRRDQIGRTAQGLCRCSCFIAPMLRLEVPKAIMGVEPTPKNRGRARNSSALSSSGILWHKELVLGARCGESRSPVLSPGSTEPRHEAGAAAMGHPPWGSSMDFTLSTSEMGSIGPCPLDRPSTARRGGGPERSPGTCMPWVRRGYNQPALEGRGKMEAPGKLVPSPMEPGTSSCGDLKRKGSIHLSYLPACILLAATGDRDLDHHSACGSSGL